MGKHEDLTTAKGIHIPYAFSYADSSARTGASGFVSGDVGKLALQEDDNSLWILTATTPTWVRTGGLDINSLSEKTSLAANDEFIIADSAASYVHKKIKYSNLPDQGTIGDMATVQVRRTTAFDIGVDFADVTFDTTDIETDSSVIEHDNSNTDRINCKETGLYLVTYCLELEIITGDDFNFMVTLNDSASPGIAGSFRRVDAATTGIWNVSCAFVVSLTANDYLTFAAESDGANNGDIEAGMIMTVTRLTMG